jgi:hypothetical protein
MSAVKILAVDDEPEVEFLVTQRCTKRTAIQAPVMGVPYRWISKLKLRSRGGHRPRSKASRALKGKGAVMTNQPTLTIGRAIPAPH